MVGEYADAAVYCRRAIKILETLPNSEAVRNYKAEAYQTLATRIAIETGDIDGAIAYLTLGANIDKLNRDWRDRLSWLIGLYNYVGGKYSESVSS